MGLQHNGTYRFFDAYCHGLEKEPDSEGKGYFPGVFSRSCFSGFSSLSDDAATSSGD
ncbi:MAG: hypothetical protein ACFFBV_00120 [Promethearchaeota archaeon]